MKTITLLMFPKTASKESTRTVFILFFLLSCYLPGFSQEKGRGVHIGLFYPLSTHGVKAGEYSNVFSLHAIAGVSKEEHAFTAAGISNIIHEDASGFQAAGISNHIGGFSSGFKAAGILNLYNSGTGFQAAGVTNISKGDVTGMQASGFLNKVNDIQGFQAAGYINIAKKVKGTQASGYLNIAHDVNGSQFSGFLNIAKKVKGVQIAGLINIADSSDYAIGIINIIKNGEKWIGLTTDDNLTTLVAFRSGGRKLYGIIGLGYNFQNEKHVFARQFGLGAHLITRNKFRLNTEATILSLENFERGKFAKLSIGVLPSLKLGSKLEIFGGPALNFINTNTLEGRKLISHYVWNDVNRNDRMNGIYIGYNAGIHLSL